MYKLRYEGYGKNKYKGYRIEVYREFSSYWIFLYYHGREERAIRCDKMSDVVQAIKQHILDYGLNPIPGKERAH